MRRVRFAFLFFFLRRRGAAFFSSSSSRSFVFLFCAFAGSARSSPTDASARIRCFLQAFPLRFAHEPLLSRQGVEDARSPPLTAALFPSESPSQASRASPPSSSSSSRSSGSSYCSTPSAVTRFAFEPFGPFGRSGFSEPEPFELARRFAEASPGAPPPPLFFFRLPGADCGWTRATPPPWRLGF